MATPVRVQSEKVRYTKEHIEAQYEYQTTRVEREPDGSLVAIPETTTYTFQTHRKVMFTQNIGHNVDFVQWHDLQYICLSRLKIMCECPVVYLLSCFTLPVS